VTLVDNIILELVGTRRLASANEIDILIAHVAQAPFATYPARVPNSLRNLLEQIGMQVPPQLPSVEWHLLKRIYDEYQWPEGTTAGDYVKDLQQAIHHPEVGLWTYHYFGRPYAGFLAPSHVRSAPQPLPYLYVAYDPQYGTITTGYQVSGYGAVFDKNCTNLVRHR
jgi:hypothetical protein